ncbi:pyruvate, phosphate dikinase [Streptomyces sp. wa22]|uniref:pyruvate, phosphate dikinase n=1 Tax=Streptomyces sp. wa22 TaxID=1828244 RepID=UPI0011C73D78|nr:pyruvate, phosphate dikinase [Streptomyces sp. wa22]TXS08851.1 pyruvate, phosphate dikinase [Streptomyces sp. wa22]
MSENKDPQKFVYDFTEGNKDLKDLLGGKGANLAEMTNLGLPVPPGFTISTEACKVYLDSGDEPTELRDEVGAHLEALEKRMGKNLGQADDPLLVSVRSGKGVTVDVDLDAADLKKLVEQFKKIVTRDAGREFPQDPREQMDLAIKAVFDSWNTDRAKLYRRQERIPGDLGTAVNICSMVFGNLGPDSGTGVAFTRDPASGHQGVYGDYLQNAQGEDVVAGIRNTVPLAELESIDKASYDQLMKIMETLETHYKDLCDIEFTIERGQLWMLQTRVGKRTAGAAFRIATQLVDQGLIDEAEALQRVNGAQLAQLMFPRFDHGAASVLLGRGIAASPGAAVGKAVFDSYTAVKWSRSGEKVILIRRETNPDDLDGMIAAEGILTSRGGKTSHAAVVARGMGKTCVCGAEEIEVDTKRRRLTVGDTVVEEGDLVSVDGSTGKVYLGEVPVVPSPVVEYFEGRMHAGADDADELVAAVHRIMAYADRVRRLRVRANADNAEDASRARRFGAQGIGLCRTEHMFLGERREMVEKLILADTDDEREAALDALLPLQKADFIELFESMDGLPVTVRLLDPPLHEFLPDITELSVRVALAESRKDANENDLRLLQAVHKLHEQNPMLGLRGVRLGLVIPGLFAMQVRAIAEAAAQRKNAKGDPRAEIMIPLVGTVQELEIVREEADQVIAEVEAATGTELRLSIGTMIELPRAALTAGQIAEAAQFFSFGTNDLTQTVWGFSRDDVEASFFTAYLEKGIFGVSPFETIDKDGVGALVRSAVEAGRATRPDLKLGICGEHGGDPESVHFFHEVGLDYVSCSPFRIPVARLEAGRAAAESRGSDSR